MKKSWTPVLAAALAAWTLVACGSRPSAPPQPGDLLSAPTTLTLGGQVLTAQATATRSAGGLGVRVRVAAPTPGRPLPGVPGDLTLSGLFVVSGAGVWKAPLRATRPPGDAAQRSLNAAAWSETDLRPGEPVQIVVRLQDRRGHTYWLRGAGRVGRG